MSQKNDVQKNQRPVALHIITGLNDGGAEAALFRLCHTAKEYNHHVVSLMDAGKYGPLLTDAGIPVNCLKMPQGKVTAIGLYNLIRIIRNLRPDVVQTWMYHANLIGGLVARLAGIKSVFWGIHHSNLSSGTVKLSTIFVARLAGEFSRFIPLKIISCSRRAIDVHVGLGYAKERFVTIPNGYDLTEYYPDLIASGRLRKEWNISSDCMLIGMVARFDPQKDHVNLLNSLQKLKESQANLKCVLIGSGMDTGNAVLLRLIADRGLQNNVLLLGRRDDICSIMNALNIHVLSSVGEAFPNVLAEAMACGTPCVTTDVGDAALIVGDTGWVIPPSDSQSLADALREALCCAKNSSTWELRQKLARKRIEENFTLKRMAAMYQMVWSGNFIEDCDN